jgi:hypothetical protein
MTRRLAVLVPLVPRVAAVALSAFTLPSARPAPRDLALRVAAAPPPATRRVERLPSPQGSASELHSYLGDWAAPAAIQARAITGAFVGSLTALLFASVALSGLRLLVGLLVGATLAGVVGARVIHTLLGIVGGSWRTTAGVLGLTVLAISSAIAGLLPKLLGQIGQWLPSGADGSPLRSEAFFGGNGGGNHHLVLLVCWAVLGLAAVRLGQYLPGRRPAPVAAGNVPAGSAAVASAPAARDASRHPAPRQAPDNGILIDDRTSEGSIEPAASRRP